MDIVITADGSNSLLVTELNETYHSNYGAITESQHIFINAGLKSMEACKNLVIFEVGFGTGLNALLTCIEAIRLNIAVDYFALEKFPLDNKLALSLNYPSLISHSETVFTMLHEAEWDQKICITDNFSLHKIRADLTIYKHSTAYDLVYFDAFAPEKQPELWTTDIFAGIYHSLNPGGVLLTYSVKGEVKRALRQAGFLVEKLPGPPGKREILRAIKKK